jgi:hypothetical protein
VKSNYSANEYTSIHNLARDRLEQLMNLPFGNAQLTRAPSGTTCRRRCRPGDRDPRRRRSSNPLARTYTRAALHEHGAARRRADPYTLSTSAAGNPCQFKRIDVTVTSSNSGPGSGPASAPPASSGFIATRPGAACN